MFTIDEEHFPEPDSTSFYTYEYTNAYNKFLSRRIKDVKFNDSWIYCLVAYEDRNSTENEIDAPHTLFVCNRQNNEKKEFVLPQTDGIVLAVGLKETGRKVEVMTIYRNDKKEIRIASYGL